MEAGKNKSSVLVGIVLIAVIAVAIYFAYANKTTNHQNSYAQNLWGSLASGDVSSSQCGKLAQTRQEDLSRNAPLLMGYFYSYDKHRCIGELVWQRETETTSLATITDLATNKDLVTCRFTADVQSYKVTSKNDCSDQMGNYWTYQDTSGNFDKGAVLATTTLENVDSPISVGPLFNQLQQIAQSKGQ